LEPDDWEKHDEELLLTSKELRRKINPMLGLIVQQQFYDDGAAKARLEGDTGEFISKYINVYQSAAVKEWLTPEDIRALQIDFKIDQCNTDDWMVFTGLDFSKGDDLNGCSYLAYNTRTGEFFADMDSWMSEKAVNESPIRELLLKWAEKGYLHIVAGKTFSPELVVNRIMELADKGVNFIHFGYDPYNAKNVINALSQWLFDYGCEPKNFIFPVRQNFATYNPAVAEFDYMVKRSIDDGAGHQIPSPMIHLSRNSLWPWEFGNVMLQESSDGMENLKPVKRDPSGKVDNVQMLLSALILYDAAEATVSS
jgi:phage terminase large subunit-like protein